MNILAVSRIDTTNLGDLVCSPCLYFDYDADPYDVKHPVPQADAYIFGGGEIANWMTLTPPPPGIKIAWGIGGAAPLTDFTLIGSRDKDSPNYWVPCASCMSPLFDQTYPITVDIVTYTNTRNPVKEGRNNRCTMEEAVRFLSSGETVVTDSYHGMYWASLLGKEVVLRGIKTNLPKFHQMKDATLTECREANVRFDAKVRDLLS